jgi:hypothetical protein
MSPLIRLVSAVVLTLIVAAPAALVAQVPPATVVQQSKELTSARIADQLGIKLQLGQAEELATGGSLTGSLVDPAKLAKLGLPALHDGARVTVTRVAPDRLRIEVDELDPVPVTHKATLTIDDTGQLRMLPHR